MLDRARDGNGQSSSLFTAVFSFARVAAGCPVSRVAFFSITPAGYRFFFRSGMALYVCFVLREV